MHARTSARSAFTLVEMLVAMTLTIFLMVILSQAFIAGLETFSGLKAIGDMQEDLRSATALLRYDLSQKHFEGERRLSDPNLLSGNASDRIRQGFFAMGQGYAGSAYKPHATYVSAANYQPEGAEDGINSLRATDHWLQFTNRQRGNDKSKVYTAVDMTPLPTPPAPKFPQPLGNISSTIIGSITNTANPGNQTTAQADAVFDEAGQNTTATGGGVGNPFAVNQGHGISMSPWAEIAWVMVQTGTTADPGGAGGVGSSGTKLFALYRLQYLVFPYTLDANIQGAKGNMDFNAFQSFACIRDPNNNANLVFLGPPDLAAGTRTFAPIAPAFGSVPRNANLVLSNVVSFHVQVLGSTGALTNNAGSDFSDLPPTTGNPQLNKSFDTATYGTSNGPSFTIQALKINIRVWDPKSRQTRQVTIVQDM